MRRPVYCRVELFGDQQLTRFAIQGVGEAVAVEMNQRLGGLALHVDVRKDHLVDAVVVPLVVGRHLVDPFRHAAVGIASEDGHRPSVVAGALCRVPCAGIAGTVIDHVESARFRGLTIP